MRKCSWRNKDRGGSKQEGAEKEEGENEQERERWLKLLCFPEKPMREVFEKERGRQREWLHFTLHCAMLFSHIRSRSPASFKSLFHISVHTQNLKSTHTHRNIQKSEPRRQPAPSRPLNHLSSLGLLESIMDRFQKGRVHMSMNYGVIATYCAHQIKAHVWKGQCSIA